MVNAAKYKRGLLFPFPPSLHVFLLFSSHQPCHLKLGFFWVGGGMRGDPLPFRSRGKSMGERERGSLGSDVPLVEDGAMVAVETRRLVARYGDWGGRLGRGWLILM